MHQLFLPIQNFPSSTVARKELDNIFRQARILKGVSAASNRFIKSILPILSKEPRSVVLIIVIYSYWSLLPTLLLFHQTLLCTDPRKYDSDYNTIDNNQSDARYNVQVARWISIFVLCIRVQLLSNKYYERAINRYARSRVCF